VRRLNALSSLGRDARLINRVPVSQKSRSEAVVGGESANENSRQSAEVAASHDRSAEQPERSGPPEQHRESSPDTGRPRTAPGRTRKIVAAVARRLWVDPFTKFSEIVGIDPKTLLLWYFFPVVVVGVPAAALFWKRGLAASLHDGEAFLFSLALTLGVLYDHAKASFERKTPFKEALLEVLQVETLGYVLLNVGAVGVSIYFILTSSDSGVVGGIVSGRLWWFIAAVFFAVGLPLLPSLVPFIRSRLADAAPKAGNDLASSIDPAVLVPATPDRGPDGVVPR
jgi:hypothetical protein